MPFQQWTVVVEGSLTGPLPAGTSFAESLASALKVFGPRISAIGRTFVVELVVDAPSQDAAERMAELIVKRALERCRLGAAAARAMRSYRRIARTVQPA